MALTVSVTASGSLRVLAMDRAGKLVVWDAANGKILFDTQRQHVWTAAITPDGNTVTAVVSRDGTAQDLIVYQLDKQGKPRKIEVSGTGISRLTYAPNNRTLLATTMTGGLQLWNMAAINPQPRWLRKPPEVKEAVLPFEQRSLHCGPIFSPDGKTVALPGHNGKVHLLELASGQARQVLKSGLGAISNLTFSADGKRLVVANEDGSALVWDMPRTVDQSLKKELSADELETLWKDLSVEDAVKAYRAIRALAAAPGSAVSFLRRSLPPAGDDQKQIDKLIADLGSNKFAVRKKAEEELKAIGFRAQEALRLALEKKPSLDVGQRLEALLRAVEGRPLSADESRLLRAVEAVEAMGTPEAKKLLEEWSRGAPGALLTEEAKGSLTLRSKG
jgi:dipeptidyl aminopeptidase/acylaminoacyl peptidase